MILRDLYKTVDRTQDWVITIQDGGKPFPENSGYKYTNNGMTCNIPSYGGKFGGGWFIFIDRVDTCWQKVGKREVVSISNNVITIK